MTTTAGVRHLRSEWGRWWRTDDLTDTHIAHRVLNDQYRLWRRLHQQTKSELNANIGLLKKQQKMTQAMQMQRMHAMKHTARGGGGGGRRGYGGGFGLSMMMGGSSPMVTYRMMQWAELGIKINQKEFEPSEVTPAMLAAGRDQVRSRRHLVALLGLTLLPAAWLLLWIAAPVGGLVVTALATVVGAGAAWGAGRNPTRRRPPVPRLLFVPGKKAPDLEVAPDPEPFPLREAGRTPRVAKEAVRLALNRHGAPAEVELPVETAYGWRVPLTLSDGTIADIVRILSKLTTTLRVGEGRALVRPADPDDSARVELLLLTSDPFETPLPYPERAPGSASITRPVSLGISMDGETTPVVLAGQHVIIAGDTGSGKTSMVLALAEYVTACSDAVAVDIDPAKRGLRSLAPLAARTARSPEEAEAELEYLLNLAQRRIASMPPTQETWEPSPDGPAVLVFIDEHPKLSARGKSLAVDLLRLGREARITIVLCTQDATQEVLGDAIADAFGVRVLMPCRLADVPLVVGQSDAVSNGWLPHLLVPSPDPSEPADAGRFYCVTPKHRTPVLRYVSKLPSEAAVQRAKERLAADRPTLDTPRQAPAAVPEIARLLLDAFAAEEADVLTVARLAAQFAEADPETWTQWDDRKDRLVMVGRTLRSHLKKAGLDVPTVRLDHVPGRPTAYRLADVRDALS